jgi:DNA-binding PadR family transcriptional regulator
MSAIAVDPSTFRAEYGTYTLNEEGLAAVAQVRQIFSDAHRELEERVPASRYRSSMATHLEEACFAAIKGVCTKTENQS